MSRRSLLRPTVAFVLVAISALAGCANDEETPASPQAAQGAAGSGNGSNGGGIAGMPGAGGSQAQAGSAGVGNGPITGTTDFISDSPTTGQGGPNAAPGGGEDSGSGGASSGAGGGAAAGGSKGDDATKAIEEADIISVRGSQLFALSRYSGLSIIDVTQPSQLRLIGRYPLQGEPFEMYVRDGVVMAMFSSYGKYEYLAESDSYQWVNTSHIEVLDTSNPAQIKSQGAFDMPGEISDSRIVGDVLYAVTYENGYCWQCESKPTTTVTSLSVKDLSNIYQVDRLSFEDKSEGYAWRKSVSVSQDRMYVAGIEYNWNDNTGHSTVEVVDIKDPSGKLAKGASVAVHGQIESRWQMDEFEGTLRVISQPGQWNNQDTPHLQTFSIKSAQELTPLADLPVKLPMPERLRAARFDGNRGFAITAVQTDPLFTFDVTDPANPQQLGELVMPGWVYHIEPRGDRLLALGFDNQSKEGALNVSLFDVSDMTKPAMVERVAFGGDWGSFAEDQDRIHKAFGIYPDKGLVAVPYSGWEYDETTGGHWGCGKYVSGIQLIDWSNDTLKKRGVAPSKGDARRAFLVQDKLFAMSDERVRSFDISDRDAPKQEGDLALSHKVSRTKAVGDKLVRLGADWWTGEAKLELVPLVSADQVQSFGELDLTELMGHDAAGCYWNDIYSAQLFGMGDALVMVWGDYGYWYDGPNGGTMSEPKTHVATIDLSDIHAPKLVGHAELPFSRYSYYGYYGEDYGYYYYSALYDGGSDLVQVGNALALRRWQQAADQNSPPTLQLEVIDFSDISNPTHSATVPLTEGRGGTSLVVDGTRVLTSHWEDVEGKPGKARYYLDRVDLADPKAPALLPKVNIPGSLAGVDDVSGRHVTVSYKKTSTPANDYSECYGNGYYYWGNRYFDYDNKLCVQIERSLNLIDVGDNAATLLASAALDEQDRSFYGMTVKGGRVIGMMYDYQQKGDSYYSTESLAAFSGLAEGKLEARHVLLDSKPGWYGGYSLAGFTGNKVVLMSYYANPIVAVIDPDVDGAKVEPRGEARSWISNIEIVDHTAILSLDNRGIQTVDLK